MQDRIPLYPGRVKMTPVTGQANTYDMTRADDPTQAGTPLNKASLLKDATAALFGLTSTALPDDVLAEIGKYKQYWWRRRLPAREQWATVLTDIATQKSVTSSTSNQRNFTWSKTIYIDQSNGAISLDNPTTTYAYYDADESGTYALIEAVGNELISNLPCYVKSAVDGGVYYLPVGSTYKRVIGTGATIYSQSGGYYYIILAAKSGSYPDINVVAQTVTTSQQTLPASDWQYIQSSDRNAYPDSGTQDGYEYEYLGVPFDNAVTAPKIETGSYVGTGTYGASNPNTLTFGFVPKLVMIYDGSTDYAMFFAFGIGKEYALGTYLLANSTELSTSSESYAKVNGDILNWYTSNTTSSRAPRYQFNIYQTTYYYFAIG